MGKLSGKAVTHLYPKEVHGLTVPEIFGQRTTDCAFISPADDD